MARGDTPARERILLAAQELTRENGAGNLSLDAVAARAGVSKGGLLYHFPSKSRLLQALVESFVTELDRRMTASENQPDGVIRAYIDYIRDMRTCPSSGILAALAEDPGLLEPLRRHQRQFLARIMANARDPARARLAFLTLHGLWNLDMLDLDVLSMAESGAVLDEIEALFPLG